MVSRLFLAISLLLISVEFGQTQTDYYCYGSDFRLRDSVDDVTDLGNGRTFESTYGPLEICVDGTFVSVCEEGDLNTTQVAMIACQYLGYYDDYDSSPTFVNRQSEDVIDYIDCPDYSNSFSECDIQLTNQTDCPMGSDLVVTCSRYSTGPSFCYSDRNSQIESSAYFSFNDGGSIQSGFPTICFNNTKRPYCLSDQSIQQAVADISCGENARASVDPLLGDASEYSLGYTPVSSVDDVICTNYSDVSTCNFSMSDSCTLDNYNLITCEYKGSTCSEGQIFSVNGETMSYPTGRNTRTSRIETCTGVNRRVDICDDGLIDDSIIQTICSYTGFSSGEVASFDEDTHGYSGSGLYATDLYCDNEYSYSLSDCNYTISSQCSGTPLIVTCYTECQSGNIRLYNSQIAINSNDTLAITGILEVCIDGGEWATICDDGEPITDENTLLLLENGCNSLGYAGGELLSPDPASYGYSESNISLVNVECYDPYGFYYCNYNISEDAICTESYSTYLLQCVVQDDGQTCSQTSLQSRSSLDVNFLNGTSYNSGYHEACSPDNDYGAFCYDVLDDELATLICQYNGYTQGYSGLLFGSAEDFHQPLTRSGVYDYTCPEFASSIYNCQLNFTADGEGCLANGGPGLITCMQDRQSTCYNSVQLTTIGSGNFGTDSYVTIGNAEVCVNGTYAPVCSNLVTEDFAQFLCNNNYGSNYIALPYPVVGNRSNYAFSYPTSDIGVFELDCTYDQYGGNCDYDTLQYTEMDGCSLYGGHGIISCISQPMSPPVEDCSFTGEVRLANQYFSSNPNLGSFVGGTIEICVNGTYTRVCANDTYSNVDINTLATRTCNQLGYPANSLNYIFPSYFPSSDMTVINYMSCLANTDQLNACEFDTTDEGECATHSYDANVQCFNMSIPVIPDCFYDGQVQLANQMNNSYPTYDEITGGLEICVNGSYHRVCNTDDAMFNRSYIVQQACTDLGYGDGYTIANAHSSSPSVDYISCPADFLFSLSQCNYSTTDNGTCVETLNGIFISCTRAVVPQCTGGQVRINYNYTVDFNNYQEIYGTLEICVDGTFREVCGTDAATFNASDIVEAACNDIGYTDGSSYSLSQYPYMTIIDSYTCPDNYTSLLDCSFSTTNVGECVDFNSTTRISITCRRDFPVIPACYDGDVRLRNNYTQSPDKYGEYLRESIQGQVEICYNGTYYGVCSGDYNQQVAETVCSNLGYNSNTTNSTGYNYNQYGLTGINNISCPEDFTSFSECSFSFSNTSDFNDDQCNNHNKDLYVTCTSVSLACSGNFYRSSYQSNFYFYNNTQVNTGRLEVCLDGTYVPVCDSVLSDASLTNVCSAVYYGNSEYLSDQYIGDFYDYQTGTNSTVINYLSCPDNTNGITQCQYTTSYGCPSYEQVITCIERNSDMECSENNIRLGNNSQVILPFYSTETNTGRVEICRNGEFVDVCDTTFDNNDQYFANRACQYYSYDSTATIVQYDSQYSTTNRSFTVDGNCTNISDGLNVCNVTDYDGTCSSMPLTVTCERECSRFGAVRLQQTNTTYFDNGTAAVSGIMQFCESSTWRTMCENNFTDFDYGRFCTQFGYNNGTLLTTNPGGELNSNDITYVNLSCPMYDYSPAFCSIEYGDNTVCDMQVNLYCYNSEVPTCYDGEVRIGNNYYQQSYSFGRFPNQTDFRTDYVQVCIDGSFHLLCDQGLDVQSASSLCSQSFGYRLGYPGALYGTNEDYMLPSTSNGIYDINCNSNNYFSDSDCSYSTVANVGCSAYGGPALVTCVNIPDENQQQFCSGSRFTNRGSGTLSNGTSFVVGRPEVCADEMDYSPICGELTEQEAILFCNDVSGQFGALNYPLFGTSYDYPMNNQASTVITNPYCPPERFYDFYLGNCDFTLSSSTDGCSSYQPQPLLTCYQAPRPCMEGTPSLQYLASDYGENNYVYYYSIQYCSAGETYATVCKYGVTDEEADLVCQSQGYSSGYLTDRNSSEYYYYSTSNDYLYDFTCNSNNISDCGYSFADGNCSDYNGTAVIACTSGNSFSVCSPGQVTLLDEEEYYYNDDPDFPLVTGYPALCINNTYVPICNTTDAGLIETRVACAFATNYTFGYPGSDDYYLYPLMYNDSLVVTDVSCDMYGNCVNTSSNTTDCEEFATVTCGIICNENETRLYNERYTYTEDRLERVSGIPQVCFGGGWVTVCNDDTNDEDLPTAICQEDYGYRYGRLVPREESELYGPNPPGTLYSNNIECPDYIEEYREDCSENFTYYCDDEVYVVECFDYQVCIEGDIRLADSQEVVTDSGMEYTSGYPVICVNDQLVPLCNTVEFGLLELAAICYIAENRTYGFPGTLGTLTLGPFSNINTTLIATALDCNLNEYCTNTTQSTSMGCSNYQGYAEVTCAVVCEDDAKRLYNEESYYTENGLLRVTGIPQTCSNGGWTSICNDGTNDDVGGLPNLICQNFGYTGGYELTPNSTLYGSSGPGTYYINNLACYESVENCTYTETFSQECLSGDYDYVVECYNYKNCRPGDVQLTDSNTTTTSQGFIYTSGYPLICNDDELLPLCSNSMPELHELTYICSKSSNLTYGFPGTSSFVTVGPFTANAPYIATNFTCLFDTCTNDVVHSDNGCALDGGYATITCANACVEDSYRLYNNMTTYTSDGLLRATGIPQICTNGGYTSVCTSGSIDANIPNLVCQELGYQNGVMVPNDNNVSSPPGTFYITNVTCGKTLESCTSNETYNSQCLNGDLEYVVQCYNVKTSPMIIQTPQNITVIEGNSVNFTCQFNGDPNPVVQWTFVNLTFSSPVSVTPSNNIMISTLGNNPITTTLTISNPTLENAGIYSCLASNDAPTVAYGLATLQIVVVPTIELTSTDTTNTVENDAFTFTCTESGAFPAIPIVWMKGTTQIFSSSRVTVTSTTTQDQSSLLYTVQSVLTISRLFLSDSSSYTCRSSIIPGVLNEPVVSTIITLDVQVRNECLIEAPNESASPCVNGFCIDGTDTYFCQCFSGFIGTNCNQAVTTTSVPVFVTQPSDESVLLDGAANFSCIVTGAPQPSITWRMNGNILPEERSPYLIIDSVQIENRGLYSCQASNSEGSITSNNALLTITNIAQYVTFLTVSSARRKRQSLNNLPAVVEARNLALGREVAPNVIIVALDAYLVDGQTQLVFTVRAPVSEDNTPVTTGVTGGLNSLADEVSTANPLFSFSPVVRFDGCLPESTTVFDSVQLNWPEIGAGVTATLPCPCGNITDTTGLTATRMCRGDFISISEWVTPYDQECRYDEISQQMCVIASSNDDLQAATGQFLTISDDSDEFVSETVSIALTLAIDFANSNDLTSEDASNIMGVVNNLFNVPSSTFRDTEDSTIKVINTITSIGANSPLTDGVANVIQPLVAVQAQEVDRDNFNGFNIAVTINSDGQLDEDSLSGSGEATASITVVESFLTDVPDVDRLVTAVFVDDDLFVQDPLVDTVSVASIILSFDAISNNGDVINVGNLVNPITISFSVSDSILNPECTFYDTDTSLWSSDGCITDIIDNGFVDCSCDHLSSFAVVGQVETTSEPPVEEYKAEPILIVGAVVSLVIVLIAVISHLVSPTQRYQTEGRIIICSHICLIILYIVLILATVATYLDSEGFCGTLSGLFHFMSLVYVMMIFSEALFYVIKLRHGIGGSSLTRYLFIILFLASFGVPLIIVIVSAGAGFDYYALDNTFCRPQSYPFYYGYIIPVAVIYVAAIVCIIIGCFTTLLVPMKEAESSFRKQAIKPHLFAHSILSIVIFVVWIFGLIGTDYNILGVASTATQYIFGFMLIIHAIVLFVLTMIRTEDTRKVWVNILNRITGRSGKYDFAASDVPRKKTTDNTYDDIGLGQSGQFSREGSLKKKDKDAEDVVLLKTSPDGETGQVDTTFSSKAEEKKIEDEEERKRIKEQEIEDNVISNPANDEDENEKKTDL